MDSQTFLSVLGLLLVFGGLTWRILSYYFDKSEKRDAKIKILESQIVSQSLDVIELKVKRLEESFDTLSLNVNILTQDLVKNTHGFERLTDAVARQGLETGKLSMQVHDLITKYDSFGKVTVK